MTPECPHEISGVLFWLFIGCSAFIALWLWITWKDITGGWK